MNPFALKTILSLVSFFFLTQLSAQHNHLALTQNHDHGKRDISFIKNNNQWHSNVRYKASLGGINTVYLEDNAFTYVFSNHEDVEKIHDVLYASDAVRDAHVIRSHAYKVTFQNAQISTLKGLEKQSEYYNYILGNNPAKWASFVPLFKQVKYQNIYKGIELKTYSSEGHFKYDFIIEAGANPSQIILDYEGTDGIEIDNGNLIIYTSVETIIEKQPYAFQVIEGKERAIN